MIKSEDYSCALASELSFMSLMSEKDICKKYLDRYNPESKKGKEAIEEYLYNEHAIHLMFESLSYQEKLDFLKLKAVLRSPQDILEALEELSPENEAMTKAIMNLESSRQDQQLRSVAAGFRWGWDKYFELANTILECDISKLFEKKSKELSVLSVRWKQPADSSIAVLLYAEHCRQKIRKDKEKSDALNKIFRLSWPIFMDPTNPEYEVEYDVIKQMLKKSGRENATLDFYTKRIKTGDDLLFEMSVNSDFLKTQPFNIIDDAVVDGTGASNANIPTMMVHGWYGDSLICRIAKELVSKSDRYFALSLAWGRVRLPYELACGNCSQHMRKQLAMLREKFDSFTHENVYKHFKSAYLLAMYHILATRVYHKDMAEALLRELYPPAGKTILYQTAKGVNAQMQEMENTIRKLTGELERSRREKEQLTVKVDKTTASKRKEKNRSATIEQQQGKIRKQAAEIEELKKRVEQLTQSLEEATTMPEEVKQERTAEEIHNLLTEKLEKYRVIVVDGHANYCRYLERAQPNIKTIPTDTQSSISDSGLATADYIMCKSAEHGSHKIALTAQGIAKTKGIPFHYLAPGTNIKQSEKEILETLEIFEEGKYR